MAQNHRLQTEDETKDAVNALLKRAHEDIVRAILKGNYEEAITRLGEALHTVQDRVFHHFEAWPYRDIAESLMQAPNYMMCHVLRDTGYISKVSVTEQQFALGLATGADPQTYLGVEAFGPLGDQRSISGGFLGWGGMITLSFGAAPGSLRQPDPMAGRDQRGVPDVAQSCFRPRESLTKREPRTTARSL